MDRSHNNTNKHFVRDQYTKSPVPSPPPPLPPTTHLQLANPLFPGENTTLPDGIQGLMVQVHINTIWCHCEGECHSRMCFCHFGSRSNNSTDCGALWIKVGRARAPAYSSLGDPIQTPGDCWSTCTSNSASPWMTTSWNTTRETIQRWSTTAVIILSLSLCNNPSHPHRIRLR